MRSYVRYRLENETILHIVSRSFAWEISKHYASNADINYSEKTSRKLKGALHFVEKLWEVMKRMFRVGTRSPAISEEAGDVTNIRFISDVLLGVQ